MKYELQGYLVPETHSRTLLEYINELLEQYHGSHIMEPDKTGCYYLEFAKEENAQKFFYDYYKKMTPRMFTHRNPHTFLNGKKQIADFVKLYDSTL